MTRSTQDTAQYYTHLAAKPSLAHPAKRRAVPVAIIIIIITIVLLGIVSCELWYPAPIKATVHVLVVGLDYHNSNTVHLYGTINDAVEIATALQNRGEAMGHTVRTTLMLQEGTSFPTGDAYKLYPAKSEVLQRIADIRTQMADTDAFVLYYSGHGMGFPEGALVLAKPGEEAESEYQTLSVADLRDAVSMLPGKQLVILDSCYSGAHEIPYPLATEDRSDEALQTSGYSPNLFMLLASTASQLSWEATIEGHKHGYFSYYLLESLGWKHDTTTSMEFENHATLGIADELSLVVSGHLDTTAEPPALDGTWITATGLYETIRDSFAHKLYGLAPLLSTQTPQTNDGPLDMVVFQQ